MIFVRKKNVIFYITFYLFIYLVRLFKKNRKKTIFYP